MKKKYTPVEMAILGAEFVDSIDEGCKKAGRKDYGYDTAKVKHLNRRN